MTLKSYLMIAVCLFIWQACDQPKPSAQEQAPTTVEKVALYDVPPPGMIESIAQKITSIDYIFYKVNHSISLTEQNGIYTVLSHIAGQGAVPVQHGCKPIGRIYYMASGETALTGDLYFSGNCRFVLFLENEKPVYGVQLNDKGVLFLTNAGIPL